MEWFPATRDEVVKLAVPAVSGMVPNAVAPSRKVTIPLGIPAPGATAVIAALKVTACPKTVGLAEEVSEVVVVAGFTVCVRALEELGAKLPLPAYLTVIEWLPAASDAVVKLTAPAVSCTVPRAVGPSLKVTFPVGVPAPGATTLTIVLDVIACPKTEGLAEEVSETAVVAGLIACVRTVAGLLPVKLESPP